MATEFEADYFANPRTGEVTQLVDPVEFSPNDLLDSELAKQNELLTRIPKGEAHVAKLLAESDKENPAYVQAKELLDILKETLVEVQASIWLLWKKTDATVCFGIPKTWDVPIPVGDYANRPKGPPIQVFEPNEPAPTEGYTERKLLHDSQFIYVNLTWTEYKQFIVPFLPEM